ncbi:Oidioi.mRNA.OKI2018_I69.chr2.g5190.t1.cds [Oikopleura dioica]|uniref:Oidioi.mRNA.OKI2018_I69.chr2.g5190.t1.cds n=1 Tax=Oikopleura dioica TaxID=34765 RepID=A0ABN7SZL0_OIKDI|nr:Oidioi.mRNA.OKI2018_I69.chr2.g5190.t1.cds [Oikopleura dioica]
MTCSELREDGTATCFWTPTVEQIGLHTVCGLCYDVFKRPSNRNCVKIEVIHKEPPIEDPCNTTTIEGMKRNIKILEKIIQASELESDFVIFESSNTNGAHHDFKIKVFGDRDVSDLPELFDNNPHTFFQFDQACGITESPQKIEIHSTKFNNANKLRKILFESLELTVHSDTLSLPRVNISDAKWNVIPEQTPVFQYDQMYLLIGDEKIQAFQNPDSPGSFIFKSTSGPIVTSKLTLEFHSKHLKLSKLSFSWFECETTGKLNPSITSGTFVDPESTAHPVCYRYTGQNAFDETVYTGEYWNEAILPAFFNPATNDHPDRHYNFVVVKKTSGDFNDFDEVKNACSEFGMSLVYPYNANANDFWLERLNEQQASTPGLRLMIGLIYTLFSKTSGALVPSETALPIVDDTGDTNGYINFDGLTYQQAFNKMKDNGNQFIMDATTGQWSAIGSVPAGMDATFCFKTEEITTICSNSFCNNTETAQYECTCPDDGSTLINEFGIDKCVNATLPCDVEDPCVFPAVCKNLFDTAVCECPDEGSTQFLSADGVSCEIIDPCSTGLHNCDHPSLECVSAADGDYTCENSFECPCDMDCLNPPCIDLTDCFGLGSVTSCPDIDCTDVGPIKGQYRCPVGKEGNCVRPSDCEFDCQRLGPGWDCLKEKCQAALAINLLLDEIDGKRSLQHCYKKNESITTISEDT